MSDGEAAIAYLSGATPYENRPIPEVVLLDLKLPRKSGHEVLQWIRQQARFRFLPVVVLSSSRERTDVERAYALGANSYLVKSPSFEALIEMVQTLDVYWLLLNERVDATENGR